MFTTRSKEITTRPYPEPDESNSHTSHFCWHCNIALASIFRSSQRSLSLTFSYKISACTLRVCYIPCPFHASWLDRFNDVGEEYKLWSSSLCSFFVTSSLLGPSILLSTLFSDTLGQFHTHTKMQGQLGDCLSERACGQQTRRDQ
jgi:hypothetical protein